MTERGPSYFIKQAPEDESGRTMLQLEAALYRAAGDVPAWTTLRELVPRIRHYDASQAVLITDLAAGLEEIGAAGVEAPLFGLADLSRPTACALARYHRAPAPAAAASLEFLPREPPATLKYLGRPHPSMLRDLSLAHMQVIQALQQRPEVQSMLDGLSMAWTADTLVHGDLKWANILVPPSGRGASAPSILIVDWELAHWGDAAWDVGSMFHSYLAHALANAPLPPGLTPSAAAQALESALVPVRQELRSFWTAYAEAAAPTTIPNNTFLQRAIRYCAARLLQSAYEWSEGEPAIPARAAVLVQLAFNMSGGGRAVQQWLVGGFQEN
jgi:hypothetical protein